MINEQVFRLKKDGTPYKRSFCQNPELIENYDKAISDTTQVWECHHRLETHNSDGERRYISITQEELKALNMYYHRPANELIFLTASEHSSLHNKGKCHSEEAKINMSDAHKGKEPWNKGKTGMPWSGKPRSEETKAMISNSHKGKTFSEDHKRKLSKLHKGKHWKLVDGKRVYY